jgi:antitoxin ParD1/3/4
MAMNVNLTPHLEDLVRRKVASGLYNSASEVMRDALRLMEEHDQMRALRLDQLRAEIQRGLDSGPAQPWDAQTMKRQLAAGKILNE